MPSSYIKCDEKISLTVYWIGIWKAFSWHLCPMSEMNSVFNLLGTWARITLRRKPVWKIKGNRNGLLGKAFGEVQHFFFELRFQWLLSGHFIGTGPRCLETMLHYWTLPEWILRETQVLEAKEDEVWATFIWTAFSGAALESMVGKPAASMGPGSLFKTQTSPTPAPPNQVLQSYKWIWIQLIWIYGLFGAIVLGAPQPQFRGG